MLSSTQWHLQIGSLTTILSARIRRTLANVTHINGQGGSGPAAWVLGVAEKQQMRVSQKRSGHVDSCGGEQGKQGEAKDQGASTMVPVIEPFSVF